MIEKELGAALPVLWFLVAEMVWHAVPHSWCPSPSRTCCRAYWSSAALYCRVVVWRYCPLFILSQLLTDVWIISSLGLEQSCYERSGARLCVFISQQENLDKPCASSPAAGPCWPRRRDWGADSGPNIITDVTWVSDLQLLSAKLCL